MPRDANNDFYVVLNRHNPEGEYHVYQNYVVFHPAPHEQVLGWMVRPFASLRRADEYYNNQATPDGGGNGAFNAAMLQQAMNVPMNVQWDIPTPAPPEPPDPHSLAMKPAPKPTAREYRSIAKRSMVL